jgi:hypothetical protein
MFAGFVGKQPRNKAQRIPEEFANAEHQPDGGRADAQQVKVLAVGTAGAFVDHVAEHADEAKEDDDQNGRRKVFFGGWGHGYLFGEGFVLRLG